MSASHLERLRQELTSNHWVVVKECSELSDDRTFRWELSRPNGDVPLTLEFTPAGDGLHGGGNPIDDINLAYACDIVEFPDVPHLYFGTNFRGKFQNDVVEFVAAMAGLEFK